MAKITVKRRAKTKSWYRIIAPKSFTENEVGEALAYEPEDLIGRTIKINYSEISKDITKQHIICILKIKSVEGDTAKTEIVGYSLSRPFLQRAMRRKISKIEEIVDAHIKDRDIRIKCVGIAAYKANASQCTALHKAINAEVRKAIIGMDLDNIIISLATGKLQREIIKKVKTIFPLRLFEVRKVEMLNPKKVKKDLSKEVIVEVQRKESKYSGKKIKIESEEGENQKAEVPEVVPAL